MNIEDISPKQDDAQRLLALNGVPRIYWLSAEEINLILRTLATLLGRESELYKGEYPNLAALQLEWPLPEPGSEAQLTVEGGTNQKATWDNTNKKWFEDGDYVQPGTDAAYLLKSVHDADNDGVIDKAKDIVAMLTAGPNQYYGTNAQGTLGAFTLPTGSGGGTEPVTNAINKVNAFSVGYLGGLNYRPFMDFNFGTTHFKTTASITLNVADATYSRIDLIVGNSNGTITKITGVPAENPVEPEINNETQLKGAFILIDANATAPSGISLIKIFDENTGVAGGEFDVSITQGAGWALNDTTDPQSGSIDIKGTNLQDWDQLTFFPGAKIPRSEFTEVVLKIKNITASSKTDPFEIYAQGDTVSNRGRGTGTAYLPPLSTYGYDKDNIDTWQFIALPAASISLQTINWLRIVNHEVGFNCLIDAISYNDGSAPTGKEFATVGYVNSEIEATKIEVLEQVGVQIANAKQELKDDIDGPIKVDVSRALSANDIGKILHVIANVTLTYPNGGIPKMRFNIRCTETGQSAIAGQLADLDMPNKITLAGKASTYYINPVNGKLTAYGELTA